MSKTTTIQKPSTAPKVFGGGDFVEFIRAQPDALLPKRGSDEAAGLDIFAYCLAETGRRNTVLIPPHNTRRIRTGLKIRIPSGYMGLVLSRSGLATKGVFVANAPGLIDSDYRGELMVILHNGSHEQFYCQHEDRIAQLVILPDLQMGIREVTSFPESARGENGFGSTGR